jgi:hypothetical protein
MFCGREAVPAPLVAPVMLLLNDTNNIKQTISTQTISDTNNIRHKQYQTQTISDTNNIDTNNIGHGNHA